MAGGIDAMAQHMWDARRARQKYLNLPAELNPGSIAEAYRAQEVYYRLAEPVYGPVAGVKVATTTKVMQDLMGITHPCGGDRDRRSLSGAGGVLPPRRAGVRPGRRREGRDHHQGDAGPDGHHAPVRRRSRSPKPIGRRRCITASPSRCTARSPA